MGERSRVISVRIGEPARTKVGAYVCERGFCAQECVIVFIMEGEGRPLAPTGRLVGRVCPGPDAREPTERSRLGVGTGGCWALCGD